MSEQLPSHPFNQTFDLLKLDYSPKTDTLIIKTRVPENKEITFFQLSWCSWVYDQENNPQFPMTLTIQKFKAYHYNTTGSFQNLVDWICRMSFLRAADFLEILQLVLNDHHRSVHWALTDEMIGRDDTFCEETALAHLLINDVVFVNYREFKATDDHVDRTTIAVLVVCNDFFSPGGDAECIADQTELEELYRMWRKDPIYGAHVWVAKKRRHQIWAKHVAKIETMGIWNLKDLGVPTE